jgi:excisionase family DNA binding protein
MPRLLSIRDVAAQLGVSPDTVRRLIARGQLSSVRVLRRVMVPFKDVDAFCTPHQAKGESVRTSGVK